MAIDFEPMKSVADYWGTRMPIMACEECGELIQAISKYERHKPDIGFEKFEDDYRNDIVKEMADVYIACAALCNRYHITPDQIGEKVWAKMDKKY